MNNEATTPRRNSLRLLSAANLAAHTSDQLALVAIPIIAITALHSSAATTSWLTAINTLPYVFFAIPAGMLADRAYHSTMMIAGEGTRAITLAVMFWFAVTNNVNLPVLATLGVLGALGTVSFTVGVPTALPSLVPRHEFGIANSRLEFTRSMAITAGPALGGALLGIASASVIFGIAALIALGGVVALAQLPKAQHQRSTANPWAHLTESLSFITGSPILAPIVLTAIAFNTGWFCIQGVYAAYAIDELGLSTRSLGVTLAMYGVGMVLGSRVYNRLSDRVPFGRLVLIGPMFGAAASVALLASLRFDGPIFPGLAWFLFGMGPVIWTISTTTLRQHITPGTMLGNVTAVVITSTAGFRPVGAVLGGAFFAIGGYSMVLWVAGGLFLVQLGIIATSKVVRLHDLDDAQALQAMHLEQRLPEFRP